MSMVGLENLVSGRAAEVNDRKDNDLSAITDRHDLMEDRNKFAFLSLDVGESSNPPDDLTSGLMPVEDGLHDEIVPMDGLDCNSCQMIGFKNQPSKCLICGDKSTGKHYGASSCDGCKGFFRRSIRKANNYVCRWNRNCVIDKDKRNQCRFCRLKKCYQFGMKKEAVQNERDRISYQSRSTPRSHVMQPPISLLHNSVSENSRMRQAASITISDLINSEKSPIVPLVSESCLKPLSSLTELCESMNQQLKALVEWAKTLPAFARLNLDDQVSLLRASAGEQLILGVAKRSLYTKLNSLVLGNNYLLTTNTGLYPEMNSIVSAVMTDIVDPMREIRLEPTEFVLIKAIIFFDPLSRNLKGASKIKSVRRELYTQLENTISHKFPGQNCTTRFAEILALQAPLSKLAFKMKDQLKNSILTGSVRIDKLLNEMLLQEECTYNNNNSPNSTPTVSLISSSNGLKPETSFLGQTSEVPDTFGGHQSTFENNLFPTNDHCQLPWTMKNFDYLASYIETARIPQEIPHPPVQFPGAHLREAVLDQGQPHAMDINHEFNPGGRLWGNQFPVSSSGTLSNGLGPSDESSAGPGATDASLASKTGFSF